MEKKLISSRYIGDGKETEILNDVSLEAKKEVEDKLNNLEYICQKYKCECGGDEKDFCVIAEKDRFGLPFRTVICKRCGMIMLNPTMIQESYNQFYDKEYRRLYVGSKKCESDFWNKEVARGKNIYKFLEHCLDEKPTGKILEIGCGAGGILWYIKNNAPNTIVKGIDLGSEYVSYGKSKGLDLHVMTAEQLVANGGGRNSILLFLDMY